MKICSKLMTISFPEEKIQKNQIEMSRTLSEPSCIHFGNEKGPGSPNFHNSSSTVCKVNFLLPSTAADSITEGKGVAPWKHSSKQIVKTGILMTGSEFGYLQSGIPSKSTTTGFAAN